MEEEGNLFNKERWKMVAAKKRVRLKWMNSDNEED